ncbi:uncharacterized protein BDW43DRAFT_198023 [Aspergillus alliaceus]|uniref:uncharacterized protein n=1 Tax=Petromyces alliaceus TaxID=209559 RepID=UPI0012A75E28|nr:uncharacterized protein BDW43DRAFT_198023 [Aspergillus alliaceus]KAB8228990.1 hypothetical protein BDW43DRAFT_198023 [Aspergillus alliaceus]
MNVQSPAIGLRLSELLAMKPPTSPELCDLRDTPSHDNSKGPEIQPQKQAYSSLHSINFNIEQNKTTCDSATKTLLPFETVHTDCYNENQPHAILQSQKEAISICTRLLNCKGCSRRSELIKLVMAICRALLRGVESLFPHCSYEVRQDYRTPPNRAHTILETFGLGPGDWTMKTNLRQFVVC